MKGRLTFPFRSGRIVQLQSIDRVAASRNAQSDIMVHTPSSASILLSSVRFIRVQIKWERERLLTDFYQRFVTASVVLMRVLSESKKKPAKAWLSGCPVKERVPRVDTMAQDRSSIRGSDVKDSKEDTIVQ